MQLILVGDDSSDAAAAAVDWATRLAAERDAQLVVLCVVGTGQDAASANRGEGITVVHENHPASGILIAADEHDADLVVLGRRGSGGFPLLPIGTTAHHVAAACGRPIVLVPPMEHQEDRSLVERIVVGVDGLPGSLATAEWAVRNFSAAHFTVVHALELAPVFAQSGDATGEMYDLARIRSAALMEDRWTRPFIDGGVAYDVFVDEGGPAEVLLGVAARVDADLVVVGRRDHLPMRGTLGGVSQRVLAYAPRAAAMVPMPTGDEAH